MARFTIAVLGCAAAAALAPGQPRPDDAAVRAKLTGNWREISPELPREKQLDPVGGMTWNLFTRLEPDGPATAGFYTCLLYTSPSPRD